jgi:DNA invertase Pin-like site-specific DNA recombinase
MAEKPLRVAIYARISDDTEGRAAGVERQVEDCKALAERLGWTLNPDVKHVFIDNDLSASTKSKKRRPEYDALMAGVATGAYDGVLYYSNSRLTRRPKEFESVIELVEATGVRLASVTSGDVNLATADGRMIARFLAAQDAAEAERIGERVTRALVQRRERDGRPHTTGTRPFGYELGGEIVRPLEADIIRLGCKLILDGASLGNVAREWNRRGIDPPQVDRWNRVMVRKVLTRPRNAGLIEHKGKILGPGTFEAIIDTPTFDAVRAAISDRASLVRTRYQGRENLLSGFLWCGVCGNRMKVNTRRGAGGEVSTNSFIACKKESGGCGQVSRNLLLVEKYVFAVVEARLADVRPYDATEDDTEAGREFTRLAGERETVEKKIDALRNQYEADADFEAADFVPMVRKLRNRLNELEAAMRDYSSPPSTSDLSADALDLWHSGGFDERREILEAVVSQIVLHPIGKVGPIRTKAMVPATTEILLN